MTATAFTFNAPLIKPERLDAKPIKAGQLRMSTDCIARRVIQAADPDCIGERYWPIDPGVGQRGDDLCDLFVERRLAGCLEAVQEYVLPWQFEEAIGDAHLDIVARDSEPVEFDYTGVWEVKSKTSGTTPAPEDVRQVKRYLRLAELSPQHTHLTELPWRIVVINPSSLAVYGPWTVELDEDDRDELDAGFALMDRLWATIDDRDLYHDEELKAACSCRECFPVQSGEATGREAELLKELAPLMYRQAITKARCEEIRAELMVSMRPGTKLHTDLLRASLSGDMDKPRLTVTQTAKNRAEDAA